MFYVFLPVDEGLNKHFLTIIIPGLPCFTVVVSFLSHHESVGQLPSCRCVLFRLVSNSLLRMLACAAALPCNEELWGRSGALPSSLRRRLIKCHALSFSVGWELLRNSSSSWFWELHPLLVTMLDYVRWYQFISIFHLSLTVARGPGLDPPGFEGEKTWLHNMATIVKGTRSICSM